MELIKVIKHLCFKGIYVFPSGKIGITIDSIWAEPHSNGTKDIEAAEREMEMGVSKHRRLFLLLVYK